MKTTTWDDASEPHHLAALRCMCALNTPPDPAPDRSVTLTGKLPHAAILLVSLIDESRLWFKARLGLDATEAPRDQAFCVRTIEGQG
jgi:hypothetical protein